MRLNILNSLMGLCVATAAVSCSDALIDDINKQPVGGEDSDMISFVVADDNTRGGSFGNRPGSSTRATIATFDNMNSFAVYGDMVNNTNNNHIVNFYNTPVTKTKIETENGTVSVWKYSNLQYWYTDYTYSFVAVHPATANPLDYTGSKLSFSYTSPSEYDDVMLATYRRHYTSGSPDPVPFEFHHIFSRINFTAKVDPTVEENIVITRLALVNVKTKASYSITPAAITSGSGTKDFVGGWSGIDDAPYETLFEKTNVTIAPKGTHEFFPTNDACFIIPQSVSNDLELQITYHSNSDKKDKSVVAKMFNTTVASHNGKWLAGVSYTYSFTIGDNEAIIFNPPTIQSWKEAEGGNYVVTDSNSK